MPYVHCQQCGKEFKVKQSRLDQGKGKYCSRACTNEAKQTRETKYCLQCGKPFKARIGQVYCSKQCGADYRKQNQIENKEEIDEKRRAEVSQRSYERRMEAYLLTVEDPWKNVQVLDAGALPVDNPRPVSFKLGY